MWPPITITITIIGSISKDYYYYQLLLLLWNFEKTITNITITFTPHILHYYYYYYYYYY